VLDPPHGVTINSSRPFEEHWRLARTDRDREHSPDQKSKRVSDAPFVTTYRAAGGAFEDTEHRHVAIAATVLHRTATGKLAPRPVTTNSTTATASTAAAAAAAALSGTTARSNIIRTGSGHRHTRAAAALEAEYGEDALTAAVAASTRGAAGGASGVARVAPAGGAGGAGTRSGAARSSSPTAAGGSGLGDPFLDGDYDDTSPHSYAVPPPPLPPGTAPAARVQPVSASSLRRALPADAPAIPGGGGGGGGSGGGGGGGAARRSMMADAGRRALAPPSLVAI